MLKSIGLSAIIKHKAPLRIYKTRIFSKWARKEGMSDKQLCQAVYEMELGLIDGDLGGHAYKKRVKLEGRGKRSGARTIIAYKVGLKAFFMFGYAKNERENISSEELKMVKMLAIELMSYSESQCDKLVDCGKLIEVKYDE